MAEVIPFPLIRRVRFVQRQARVALGMKAESAERHVLRTVDQQRQSMLRKGVDPILVEREAESLMGAIRGAMWHQTFSGGGAA